MELENILKSIDKDINQHVEHGEEFDIDGIVDSYQLDEKSKPIIKEYVQDVHKLYSEIFEKFDNFQKNGYERIGKVISTITGAGLGALAGYVADTGPIGLYAGAGATVGLATEALLHPTSTLLMYRYAASEINSCKEPRRLYREKALSRLEGS